MFDSPLAILFSAGVAVFILYVYLTDLKKLRRGDPPSYDLPGTTTAPILAYIIGIVGAVALVGVETAGEYALGISEEQSDIAALFLVAMLGAGVVEEAIFRGFLVVRNKGRAMLLLSIFGFSALFALLHPHLWSWEEGTLGFHFTSKAIWSTTILFANSVFWYWVRFQPANRERSIFPCMAAHAASNLAVFFIKLAQGNVTSWY